MKSNAARTISVGATVVVLALLLGVVAAPVFSQTTEPQPPPRPMLYLFEHVTLREAALNYDQDIQALIANPRQATDPIVRLFSKAAMRAVRTVPDLNEETMFDDITSFMGQIRFRTIQRGGYTIHLMRMPPPEYAPEAHFIAIVYKDGEPLVEGDPAPSTRYITFEKTAVDGQVFAIGEWDKNGRHRTHGLGASEPTIQSFIANVFVMLGIDGADGE